MSDEVIYLDISKSKNYSLNRDDLNAKNEFKDGSEWLYNSTTNIKGIEIIAALIVTKVVRVIIFIFFKL